MNRTALLAALVVALVGVALFGLYMKRFEEDVTGGEMVSVLMVSRDLLPGDSLTEQALAYREIPTRYVESRNVRREDLPRVMGVKVGQALRANQSLLWTDLATSGQETRELSNLLREGMRAMTIQVSGTSAFGGLLRPGDRVDVLMTAVRPGGSERVTVPLLQNVLVLAVGADTGGIDDERPAGHANRSGRDVTLALTVEQASLVTHAEDRGALQLILRNPDDVAILENVPETTDESLLQAEERARVQVRHRPARPTTPDQPVRIERVE